MLLSWNLKSKPLKDPCTYLLIKTLYPLNDLCLNMKGLLYFHPERYIHLVKVDERCPWGICALQGTQASSSILFRERKGCPRRHAPMHPCMHGTHEDIRHGPWGWYLWEYPFNARSIILFLQREVGSSRGNWMKKLSIEKCSHGVMHPPHTCIASFTYADSPWMKTVHRAPMV